VQSGQAAGPPNEAEYNAVYAAVTATERGRWFLAEYANRNRSADTDLVMAAIARIEAAIGAGASPQLATSVTRDLTAAAAPILAARADAGERDDDFASAQRSPSLGGIAAVEAKKDRDYSDAVAAIAASLTARVGELAECATKDLPVPGDAAPELERVPDVREPGATENVMENALSRAGKPQQRVPQDNAPRWHIEAPDFLFDESGHDARNGSAKPAGESALSQSQLLGAALLSVKDDEAADAFVAPPRAAIAVAVESPIDLRMERAMERAMELGMEMPMEPAIERAMETVMETAMETPMEPGMETVMELRPAAVSETPAAATPVLGFSPPEVVPFAEIPRPQLRIANDPAPVNQPPRRYDSLTATDSLSEDEVIALFG
jgi:hypothetical protein